MIQSVDLGWYIEIVSHFVKLSQAKVTEQTAWDAINFAKAALTMIDNSDIDRLKDQLHEEAVKSHPERIEW